VSILVVYKKVISGYLRAQFMFNFALVFTIGFFSLAANTYALEFSLVSKDGDSIVEYDANDVLKEKSNVKVRVTDDGKPVAVFLVAGSESIMLGATQGLSQEEYLPAGDTYIELEGITGSLDVIATNNALTEKAEVNAIKNSAIVYQTYTVLDRVMTVPDLKNAKKVDQEITLAVPEFDVSNKFLAIAEKLDKEIDSATRGANEIRIFRDISPSVVMIHNEKEGSIGTGSIIEKGSGSTLIITNNHVVDGADRVKVYVKKTRRGSLKKAKNYFADVIKKSPSSDLALIEIHDVVEAPVIKVDYDLNEIEIGQDVHAIGHPKGEFWSYTKGYVSQLRDNYTWETEGGKYQADLIIQTQTPINTGNSGGPLLDDTGKMVGVNSFINTEGQGMNYAISSADVKKFLDATPSELKKKDEEYKKSKLKVLAVDEKDLNKDGSKEIISTLDMDGDGQADAVLIEDKKKGSTILMIDNDNNGKFEAKLVDKDTDGNFDYFFKDKDEDGEWDVVGIDRNGDGKPDDFKEL